MDYNSRIKAATFLKRIVYLELFYDFLVKVIMKLKNTWAKMVFRKKTFESIIQPHIKHLYQVAYRLCGNTHDSEDLIQDLLIKLYPQKQKMQSIKYLRAWMAKVLYNLYLDSRRREQRTPMSRLDNNEPLLNEIVDESLTPDDLLENNFTQQRLLGALSALKEEQRVLIILSDVEGYSLEELTTTFDVPIGTIKSRLSRARSKLRASFNMEPYQQNYRSNA